MAKKRLKLLKISGGVLLILGGITLFSKYLVVGQYMGVLIAAISFFVGIWLIGDTVE